MSKSMSMYVSTDGTADQESGSRSRSRSPAATPSPANIDDDMDATLSDDDVYIRQAAPICFPMLYGFIHPLVARAHLIHDLLWQTYAP